MTTLVWNTTCAFCEAVAHYVDIFLKKANSFFISAGYARAASRLAAQGYHKEAKELMMYKEEEISKL